MQTRMLINRLWDSKGVGGMWTDPPDIFILESRSLNVVLNYIRATLDTP